MHAIKVLLEYFIRSYMGTCKLTNAVLLDRPATMT